MRQRNLHRDAALRSADVPKGLVSSPRESLGHDLGGTDAKSGHCLPKAAEPIWIAVEAFKRIPDSSLRFTLGLAGLQSFGKGTPEAVQSRVDHFEQAANVGGFLAIQVKIGLRRVSIELTRASEQPQGHKSGQEVPGATWMQPKLLGECLAVH